MISKQSIFLDRNVSRADGRAFLVASHLEKELSRLALVKSLYPERSTSWSDMTNAFAAAGFLLWRPNEKESLSFFKAAKSAHRMESSLMIDRDANKKVFGNFPLTLRIKFYAKNSRSEFLVWTMHFGDAGMIHNCSMAGSGALGQKVMS